MGIEASVRTKTVLGVACAALAALVLVAFAGAGPASAGATPYVTVVEFSDSPDPVRVGQNLTYSFVVRNSGSSGAEDVTVLTGVPSTTRFVSSEFFNGDKTRACPPNERGHIDCVVGDLGVGEEAVLEVVVKPGQPGHLENIVPGILVGGFGQPGFEEFVYTRVLPPERCTVVGTGGVDEIVGTPGPDTICAFGGDDSVRGGGGADEIHGGPGKDFLKGEAGPDDLYGGDGADTINARDGVRGNDEARGGARKDTIHADPGDLAQD